MPAIYQAQYFFIERLNAHFHYAHAVFKHFNGEIAADVVWTS